MLSAAFFALKAHRDALEGCGAEGGANEREEKGSNEKGGCKGESCGVGSQSPRVCCSNTGCEVSGESLKACGRCKMARYCERDCQVAHWKAGHKKDCALSPT